MDMTMEIGVLLGYAFGILILYVICYIFLVPVKAVLKLLVNSILGGIILIIINAAGSFFGFHIAFNVISAAIAGLLGIPGIILLVLMNLFLI